MPLTPPMGDVSKRRLDLSHLFQTNEISVADARKHQPSDFCFLKPKRLRKSVILDMKLMAN